MSNTASTSVPMIQKIAFGLGMLANQMFPAVLGIFMVVLVQDLGFPGWMWGVIYLLPRLFDSITDPIMGFISDNTRSIWGRRRQYVLIGAIIMGLAFIIMWQIYREDGINYIFGYFLGWSFVFYLGLTIFSVPYVAMGYEMSDNFHERTNIMAIAQWIGQWAWVIAPWFWVVMYDPTWFPDADTATRELSIWVGIVCTILAIMPAIFVKGESTKDNTNLVPLTLKNIGGSVTEIISGFKDAFSYKEFRKLCFSTFLIFNAFNTIAAFSFFIIVWYLFKGDAAAAGIWPTLFGSVGALVTTFVVIPIVTYMSKKMGKKNAFITSQAISILGYILLWFLFVPGKPWMFIFALPFFSFGIGSLFTLMMSMTADVCDLDELNTGKRREGIFGAIYWWMVKFGFAIAGGLSGLIMSLVGFDAGLDAQPEGAITGLRLFYSGLPILGTSIAIWLMWDYDLTEQRANEIRNAIDAKKNLPKRSSEYWEARLKTFPLPQIAVDADDDGRDFITLPNYELKKLFQQKLQERTYGMCFSPYEEGQNIGDILSEEQIDRRMNIIAPYTNWVRSFSCTDGNQLIPEVARRYGLKTMVGAWIDNDKERNKQEIENLIHLANSGQVDFAVVGNEVLLRKELELSEILEYINQVKQTIPEHIPVAYVDAYYQFYQHPELIDACDIIPINCYPFWEGSSIEDSSTYLKQMYALIQERAIGKKVIIAETGWPSKGENKELAVPSEANAQRYFITTMNWQNKQNIPIFYFSSFDESWKVHHEGDVGDRWGIWDKNEKRKF